jgi:hypothetical protein
MSLLFSTSIFRGLPVSPGKVRRKHVTNNFSSNDRDKESTMTLSEILNNGWAVREVTRNLEIDLK